MGEKISPQEIFLVLWDKARISDLPTLLRNTEITVLCCFLVCLFVDKGL